MVSLALSPSAFPAPSPPLPLCPANSLLAAVSLAVPHSPRPRHRLAYAAASSSCRYRLPATTILCPAPRYRTLPPAVGCSLCLGTSRASRTLLVLTPSPSPPTVDFPRRR
ncbi:hypothetical protein EDB86DRAFT_3101082 [Lactarius hatsudake]|nr:hypothetical protein EDB86DRAFT_3101082 [Lactarius hatsudake]